MKPVLVYDPDGLNPYGRELAFVLRQDRVVSLLLARDAEWVPTAFEVLAVLPGNRGAAGRLSQGLALLHGLWLVARRCFRGRSDLVVAWTRSSLEELLFALLARTGTKVVFVEHNPRPRHHRSRLRAWTMRLMRLAVSRVVVHGPGLARETRELLPRARVTECMHPPYPHWWEWVSAQAAAPAARAGKLSLLMLGGLRPDKGHGELPAILAAVPEEVRSRVVLSFCGRRPSDRALPDLAGLVRVEDRTAPTFLDDRAVGEAVAAADVLLAPVRGATQSGAVILALSAGRGVLAYDEGEISLVLDEAGLVGAGDQTAFAERIAEVADGAPAGRARMTLADWMARCGSDWTAALQADRSAR